jgi:hypothetical protein
MSKASLITAMMFSALAAANASTLTDGIDIPQSPPSMDLFGSTPCLTLIPTPKPAYFVFVPVTLPEIDCFVNNTPVPWTNMDIMAPYPGGPVAGFLCGGDLFLGCNISLSADQTTLDILFSGTDANHPGIPSGATFAIEIGTGWLPGKPITVAANVPEPSPGVLIACALLLAWTAVRFKRAARHPQR